MAQLTLSNQAHGTTQLLKKLSAKTTLVSLFTQQLTLVDKTFNKKLSSV